MTQIKKSTQEFIINTEDEVKSFLEKQKAITDSELTAYTSQLKEVKSKGEIIDTYYLVKITRKYEVE